MMKLNQPSIKNQFNCEYISLLCLCLKKYQRYLADSKLSDEKIAQYIWNAPFAVISHNADSNPLFVYANHCALNLFEMTWQQLIHCHSQQSAELEEQSEREKLLKIAYQKGFIDNYNGIRISSTGRRFRIYDAIIWNLTNSDNQYIGQAAMFKHWEFIVE